MPQPNKQAPLIVTLLCVGFVGWSLYGAVVPVETYLFRMGNMAFIFALVFLVYPAWKNAGGPMRWLDAGAAFLGVVTMSTHQGRRTSMSP